MKRLAATAFLLLSAACQGPTVTDTKTVEADAPMEMPSTGWSISYDLTVDGDLYYDDAAFDCFVQTSTGGRAGDYCGFVVEIHADAFSFDTNSFFGSTTTGAGDDDGAVITTVTSDHTYVYTIQHLSEI